VVLPSSHGLLGEGHAGGLHGHEYLAGARGGQGAAAKLEPIGCHDARQHHLQGDDGGFPGRVGGLAAAAYRDLAGVAETAAGTEGPARARLTAIAQAIRVWALTNAHRYLLIYGTPVPGYQAPPEATALASRIFAPVVAGFAATGPAGDHRSSPEQAMRRSLVFWTRLHGVISLEAAGHFTGMAVDPARLYAGEVESAVADLR